MVTVSYDHELAYAHEPNGNRSPQLTFRVSNPAQPTNAIDVDAYVDSGADGSLLNGWIARVLGIDVLSGYKKTYQPTAGPGIDATHHAVRLEHANLGVFELEVGFTLGEIRRNLLGRDFFNLVQIGFRERHLAFYVSPRP